MNLQIIIKLHHVVTIALVIILVSLLIYYFTSNPSTTEHMTSTNDEALQNVASLYNTSNLTVTNLSVTGSLKTGSLNILPTGCIIAFNGQTAPTGWALCDGTQGTPDLRGKFIFGYDKRDASGVNGSVGLTGGEKTHTLTIDEIPNHTHGMGTSARVQLGPDNGVSFGFFSVGDKYIDNSHSTTGSNGGSKPHNIMPPYYVLTYIMKL